MGKNKAIAQYASNIERDSISKIVDDNMHLVNKAVASICKNLPDHIERDDMFQVGCIGLLKASQQYTGENGAQFSTYAYYKIRGAIFDEVRSSDWKPRRAQQRTKEIAIAINKLERLGQFNPQDMDIAAEIGISMDEYNKWIRETATSKIIPMSGDIGKDYDAASSGTDMDTALQNADIKKIIKDSLHKLPNQSSQIVSLHYMEDLTFKEIGYVMGLSASKCSRIFKKSLIIIKAHIMKNEVVGG